MYIIYEDFDFFNKVFDIIGKTIQIKIYDDNNIKNAIPVFLSLGDFSNCLNKFIILSFSLFSFSFC
tara:strand:+ start:335 stop:532 length:198 start_codon:yes stop_codon:yes gene_type:complete